MSPFFRMLGNKPELLRAFTQLYGVVTANWTNRFNDGLDTPLG